MEEGGKVIRIRRWGWQDRLQITASICQAVLWLVAFLANWPLWVFITLIAIVLITIGIEHLWPMSHKKAEDIASRAVVASFVMVVIWAVTMFVHWVYGPKTTTAYACTVVKEYDLHLIKGTKDTFEIGSGVYFGKAYTDTKSAAKGIEGELASTRGARVKIHYHRQMISRYWKAIQIERMPDDGIRCG